MIIYLTGMSGAGKTVCGSFCADKLDACFIDTDIEIIKKAGMSINDIFEKHSESHFRMLETEIINELAPQGHTIIATGGGLVINEDNYKLMCQKGKTVCLMRSPGEIWDTIDIKSRPLIKAGGFDKFMDLYNTRRDIYISRCDIVFEGDINYLKSALYEYCKDLMGGG